MPKPYMPPRPVTGQLYFLLQRCLSYFHTSNTNHEVPHQVCNGLNLSITSSLLGPNILQCPLPNNVATHMGLTAGTAHGVKVGWSGV
jgi:hypothetical protein